MWYLSIFLILLLYATLTWRSLKEASSPLVPCPAKASSASEGQTQHQCFHPAVVVGDLIILQLELYQPVATSKKTHFRWTPVETCRVNATVPPPGRLPELLTKKTNADTVNITNNTSQSETQTSALKSLLLDQTCQVRLPDFSRHRSSSQESVQPLKARFLVFHRGNDDNYHFYEDRMVGATDPFFLTRIMKHETTVSGFGKLVRTSKQVSSSSSRSAQRNLLQNPFPQCNETTSIDARTTKEQELDTTMWVPYLKFGRNSPVRIRFVAEHRGYAFLQRADGIRLQPFNATSYAPIMYVDELSLPHNAQVELSPAEDNRPPIALQIKFGSILPTVDAVNRQVHMAFHTAESVLSGPELDEIRYFLQDERLYRFALSQIISYLHMWLDYLAFRDEIRFYRGRQNLSGVSSTTVLTRLGCSIIIFLYLLDGGRTSWVVLTSIFASCVTEAWKVYKLLKPSWTPHFPFVKLRQLQSRKDQETAEYDRIACRYLAMALYPLVAVWSLYALKHYEYASWYSWFISNMANAVYTFGFISLCPQLYVNYRLKSVAHLPWKVFVYKIFNTFVDDAFAWLIEMPMKHRLMTLRDDVVFLVFLVQVYIYRVDKNRTNEFGYSYDSEQEGTVENKEMEYHPSPRIERVRTPLNGASDRLSNESADLKKKAD